MAYNPQTLQYVGTLPILMTGGGITDGLTESNSLDDLNISISENKRYSGRSDSNPAFLEIGIYHSIRPLILDISANQKLFCIRGSVRARQLKFENNMYVLNIYINDNLVQSTNDCFDQHTDLYGRPNLSNMEEIFFEYCLNDDPSISNGDLLNSLPNFIDEAHNAYKIKFEIKHAYEDVFIDSNVVLYVPNEIYLDTYAYINRNYSSDDKHTKYVLIETQSSLSDTSLYLKHLQSWIVDNQTNNLKNAMIPITESTYCVDVFDYLQTEFTANSTTGSTWHANYVKSGSNGSYYLTDSSSNLTKDNDQFGFYYTASNTFGAYLDTYPNLSELLLMDEDGTDGFSFEIWVSYDSGLLSAGSNLQKSWIMGMETNWGPYICLNDTEIGGIGTTPKSATYDGLENPGYITSKDNQLLHIVGYWKRNGSYFDRGVYINGVHYPQRNTQDSGRPDKPGLDSSDRKLYIAAYRPDGPNHVVKNSIGIKIYSFRIWHTRLDSSTINKLYASGPNSSIIREANTDTKISPSIYIVDSSYNRIENPNPDIRGIHIDQDLTSLYAHLQTEFTATSESQATWYANYVKSGSNGSNYLTNSSSNLTKSSDNFGYYYTQTNLNDGAYLDNYPNISELLLMDEDGTDGFSFEIWASYDSTLTGNDINKGWFIGMETSWGPFICLDDDRIGGIGTTPGYVSGNGGVPTYDGLNSPGYIKSYENELLHIVGYWKRNGTYFDRGVYINGVHYPQNKTADSNYADRPELDNQKEQFRIFNRGGNETQIVDHNSDNTKVYSFRIWHTRLDSNSINKLYSYGPNASVMIERFKQGYNQSRIIKKHYDT